MDAPTPGSASTATGAAGHTVGHRYRLENTVGAGGMGTVWRAFDQLLRRDVAVKEVLLPPGLPAGERQVLCERTLREARAAAALNHPAVVRVYDVVQDGERPWIVMELLEARSISEILRDDGPIPVRNVAEIGLAVLGALEAAHRVGVLHRDVKPGNVLIGVDGRTTLTDFGVARSANESPLTSTGLLLGSPQYIAPERARGQAFGPASDLWSLGATLYTAVEGRPPFDRGDPLPTMTAVVCEPPDEVAFAGPLEPVLDGLLAKDPAERWDAARTRSALKAVLNGGIVAAAAPLAQPTTPAKSVSTARRAITNRLANAVAPRSPARTADSGTKALEGTAAMEAPSFTGTQPSLPITGESALVAGSRPDRSATAPTAPAEAKRRDGGAHRPAPATRQAAAPSAAPAAAPAAAAPARRVGAGQPTGGAAAHGVPRRALYLESDEAMRASAAGHTSAIPRSRFTERQRWALFATAAAAIVLLAFGGAYALARSASSDAPSRWTSKAPASATSGIALEPYRDPNGYSVNVPENWTPKWQDPGKTRIKFFEDATEAVFLQLYVQKVGTGDQQKVWEAGERYQKRNVQNYERVKFAPAKIGGKDAVDWEWRFTTKSGQRRHVLDRGIIINGTSYQLYFSAPEERYAAGVKVLDEVSKSFQLIS